MPGRAEPRHWEAVLQRGWGVALWERSWGGGGQLAEHEPLECAGSKGAQQLLGCMDSGTACRSKEGIIP